jgi:hypothetical protein
MTIQQASRMLNEVEAQLGEEFARQYYFTLRTEDDDRSGAQRVVEVLLRDAGNGWLVATFPIDEATTTQELADAIRSRLEQKRVKAHES